MKLSYSNWSICKTFLEQIPPKDVATLGSQRKIQSLTEFLEKGLHDVVEGEKAITDQIDALVKPYTAKSEALLAEVKEKDEKKAELAKQKIIATINKEFMADEGIKKLQGELEVFRGQEVDLSPDLNQLAEFKTQFKAKAKDIFKIRKPMLEIADAMGIED